MEIWLTGGGSGGHITPALSVAREIKRRSPNSRISYVIERGNPLIGDVRQNPNIDSVRVIFAGKYRRYNAIGFWSHLTDVSTILKNIRDGFYILIGTMQAFFLLMARRPKAIFIKGGFVGVPVGLSAAILHIPFVTHDSDPIAGLANRIIGRWARVHAIGVPAEYYQNTHKSLRYTGVPVRSEYSRVTASIQSELKQAIGIKPQDPLLLVVGGSLGAARLDEIMDRIMPRLLEADKQLQVIHIFGHLNEKAMSHRYVSLNPEQSKRVKRLAYIDDFYKYSGAADVIVARAGATNLAEFALQGKACILVPNDQLVGGHQSINAKIYEEQGGAIVLTEELLNKEPRRLANAILHLLQHTDILHKLEDNISKLAKPNASADIAEITLELAGVK